MILRNVGVRSLCYRVSQPENYRLSNPHLFGCTDCTYLVNIITRAVKKFPEFFDLDDLVYHEFVPPEQMLLVFLPASFAAVARYSSEEAARQAQRQWFVVHDNARINTSLVVQQMSHREKYSCHRPTSVLSGSRSEYLWLFLTLKMALERTHYSLSQLQALQGFAGSCKIKYQKWQEVQKSLRLHKLKDLTGRHSICYHWLQELSDATRCTITGWKDFKTLQVRCNRL
jgi:hypothetical protein